MLWRRRIVKKSSTKQKPPSDRLHVPQSYGSRNAGALGVAKPLTQTR